VAKLKGMSRFSILLILAFSLNFTALCQTNEEMADVTILQNTDSVNLENLDQIIWENIIPISYQSTDQTDSLIVKSLKPSELYQKYFGKIDSLHNDYHYMQNIKKNPFYYRLFFPLVHYHSPIEQVTESLWEEPKKDSLQTIIEQFLPVNDKEFTSIKRINRQVDRALLELYKKHLNWITTTESSIQSRNVFREDVGITISPKTSIMELFRPEKVKEDVDAGDVIIRKPNFWNKGGSGSIKFSQNHISENWYKGGESNYQLMSELRLFTNYNDKRRVQFDNALEIRIGFNSVPSDTVRTYRINTDVLRLTSKLGILAGSKWFYTLSTEFNTQFFNNYKANSKDVVSAFMAPANLTVSLGMDYKLNKNKINLSVEISPLAYNLRYVGDSRVDETQFGLEKDKTTLDDFGSKFLTNMTWKIIPSITWTTRLYCFTNYEKVEADWENKFNFVLNRYLSTELFFHTRFDDGVKKKEDMSYFQFKEYLSFGINYAW